MSNLIITLKEKDTNTETNFIFNNGVYKLLPGTTDNFVENQVDKINFVPIENVFLLMIGSSDTIQSVSQKQDIYNKYLNLSNYNFSNYNINISTENNICLFDSDTLNLNIHSVEIADEYGIDPKDIAFGLVVVLYSINNIKENNNG